MQRRVISLRPRIGIAARSGTAQTRSTSFCFGCHASSWVSSGYRQPLQSHWVAAGPRSSLTGRESGYAAVILSVCTSRTANIRHRIRPIVRVGLTAACTIWKCGGNLVHVACDSNACPRHRSGHKMSHIAQCGNHIEPWFHRVPGMATATLLSKSNTWSSCVASTPRQHSTIHGSHIQTFIVTSISTLPIVRLEQLLAIWSSRKPCAETELLLGDISYRSPHMCETTLTADVTIL